MVRIQRVAKNPAGVLITFADEGGNANPLLELLGPDDYATLPRHQPIGIERSYGRGK